MSGAAYEEFRLMLVKYKYPLFLLEAFRAEVLREAADALKAEFQHPEQQPGLLAHVEILRRMAEEAKS